MRFLLFTLFLAAVLTACNQRQEILTEEHTFSIPEATEASLQTHTASIPAGITASLAMAEANMEEQIKQSLSIPQIFSDNISFTENKGQLERIYKVQPKDIGAVKYYTNSFAGTAYFSEDGIGFGFLRWQLDLAHKMKYSDDPVNERIKKADRNYSSIGFNMFFEGRNEQVKIEGSFPQASGSNYFHGNDPEKYITNVQSYQEILYKDLYRNIDLRYYIKEKGLQFDYIVKPGADVKQIKLRYEGLKSLKVNTQNELEIETEWGVLIDKKLYSYQIVNGQKKEVNVRYKVSKENTVSFEVIGEYDRTKELIIDPPSMTWSTFLGDDDASGNGYIHDIAMDAGGNIYGTGWYGIAFPMNGAFDNAFGGDEQIVFKLNPAGTTLLYSSYIGGNAVEYGFGIDVDATGNAYVAGYTNSVDYPIAGTPVRTTNSGGFDITIAKVNPAGNALVYSGYYGGTLDDYGYAIAVNGSNEAYITGLTNSTTTISTGGAYQTVHGGGSDAFILKLNAAGSAVQYCTYYGGTGNEIGRDIDVNAAGNAFIAGATTSTGAIASAGVFQTTYGGGSVDAFIAQINNAGNGRVYGTYLGGIAEDKIEEIVLNTGGQAIVVGYTRSYVGAGGFPAVNALQGNNGAPAGGPRDAFMAHVNTTGTALITCTFLGSADEDMGRNGDLFGTTQHKSSGVTVNASGNIAIALTVDATTLPTVNAVDATFNGHGGAPGGQGDVYVAVFSTAENTLDFSTYLGGFRHDYPTGGIRFDPSNPLCIVVAGSNHSDHATFPTTAGVYMTTRGANTTNDQGFVTKYCDVVLPVELASFTARVTDQKDVLVEWKTVMEKNNDYFEVERSSDGIHFTKIGEVDGSGNSNIMRSYSFPDKEPLPGVSYYRLRQVDYDGTAYYSQVVSVNAEVLNGILVYPNPVSTELTISHFFNTNTQIQLRLMNALGQEITGFSEDVSEGVYQVKMDMSTYPEGVYWVEIRTGEEVMVEKITKH